MSAIPNLRIQNIDQLLTTLGGVHPRRVLMEPPPGKATVADVVRLRDEDRRLFELVDRTLVEKEMGFAESFIGVEISYYLRMYLAKNPIGELVGADGMMRIFRDLVRLPDVAFISHGRLPDGKIPDEQVPELVPDLAVEILSPGNTKAEMTRKLAEYFTAGVRLVWFVDRSDRTVVVYTAPEASRTLTVKDSLGGGDVLPGFRLSLAKLFERVPKPKAKPKKKK